MISLLYYGVDCVKVDYVTSDVILSLGPFHPTSLIGHLDFSIVLSPQIDFCFC